MVAYNENGNYTQAQLDDGSIMEGELTWEQWESKYKPVINHLDKYSTPEMPSRMFETYGEEVEFVASKDPKYVWTYIQGDMSDLLVAGASFVNRLGYYVCEVPWETGDEQVLISVEVECDCYKEQGYGPFTFPNGDEYWENGDPECQQCEGYGLRTAYVD